MKRKGRDVSGWLVLDKPQGMTSAHICTKVRKLYNARKIGHAGTLDPLASGILPLALGHATKTVPFAVADRKSYQFIVTFGQERDSDDREGNVIASSAVRPDDAQIKKVLTGFIGEIEQSPPIYSAIKIDGRRACDRVRRGEEVQLAARKVHIHNVCFKRRIDPSNVLLEADTGKGVYIRSLGRDIARACGAHGYISYLRRTRVGHFYEKDSVTLDKLLRNRQTTTALDSFLLPLQTVLADIPALQLSGHEAYRFQCGQRLPLDEAWRASFPVGEIVRIDGHMPQGFYIGLGLIERGVVKPKRILIQQ